MQSNYDKEAIFTTLYLNERKIHAKMDYLIYILSC